MVSVFAGKRIVVGITGSISAFKVAGWVSELAQEDSIVSVIMTESATRFVSPFTFGALTGNHVHTEMFDVDRPADMAHIDLGREAELVLIAPATANILAKLANGLADDLISTTVLATRAKVVICPAMNPRMYSHPATKKNIERLKTLGYEVVDPETGVMACKEEGQGRLPEWHVVKECLARKLSQHDLKGQRVLVTAGPTREAVDPARYLSNRSSGKMGYSLARAAYRRGAEVVLVSGPVSLPAPVGVEMVSVQSAQEMYNAVMEDAGNCTIIIKAAAVADFCAETTHQHKIKKEKIKTCLQLRQNRDILKELGENKKKEQVLVGFAAESENHKAEGMRKLKEKNLDLIAVNDISKDNAGFEVDNNQVLLLDISGETLLPHTTKEHTADLIFDRILTILSKNS